MKTLYLAVLLLVVPFASASEPLSEFTAIAKNADRLELRWRDDIPVEEGGVRRVKLLCQGKEQIIAALDHLAADTTPHPFSGDDKNGQTWIDGEALICGDVDHFTHRLRAFSGEKCIAEMFVALDGRHVALIYNKEKIRITDSTLQWLLAEGGLKRDIEIVQETAENKKRANQALLPTPTAVTPAASHPPRQP